MAERTLRIQRGDWVKASLPQAERIGKVVAADRESATVEIRFDGGPKRLTFEGEGLAKLARGRWQGRRFVV